MVKKNIHSALSASLKAEDDAIRSRFENAEKALSAQTEEAPPTPTSSEHPKKTSVIRDSFTLPQEDYELIGMLQNRCLNLATNVNKSELMRAGLHALNNLSDRALLAVVADLTKVKTGRPKKSQ